MKLGQAAKGLEDALKAVAGKPTSSKAYERKAEALQALGRNLEAYVALTEANRLNLEIQAPASKGKEVFEGPYGLLLQGPYTLEELLDEPLSAMTRGSKSGAQAITGSLHFPFFALIRLTLAHSSPPKKRGGIGLDQ